MNKEINEKSTLLKKDSDLLFKINEMLRTDNQPIPMWDEGCRV